MTRSERNCFKIAFESKWRNLHCYGHLCFNDQAGVFLTPGVLSTFIVESFAFSDKFNAFRFLLYTLIFSVITYSLVGLPAYFWDSTITKWNVLEGLGNDPESFKMEPRLVLIASMVSVCLAIVFCKLHKNKSFFKLMNNFNITRKFGDDSVFVFLVNSDDVDYLTFHDYVQMLTYQGQVVQYKETSSYVEILMIHVHVYDYESAKLMYNMDRLYRRFSQTDLMFESVSLKTKQENQTTS